MLHSATNFGQYLSALYGQPNKTQSPVHKLVFRATLEINVDRLLKAFKKLFKHSPSNDRLPNTEENNCHTLPPNEPIAFSIDTIVSRPFK